MIAVPIAKRLGLGSVLGYLLAGVAIGPHVLGLLGTEGRDVMHFAELGVVMMLFVVGLELEPSLLWRLRRPSLGTGGLQVLLTTAVVFGIGLALRLPWQAAVAVGMILAMSSTAIVLQSPNEKGLLKTARGQSSFSVLLFQDIAVTPMLAVFPMLVTGRVAPDVLPPFRSGQQRPRARGKLPLEVGVRSSEFGFRLVSRPRCLIRLLFRIYQHGYS